MICPDIETFHVLALYYFVEPFLCEKNKVSLSVIPINETPAYPCHLGPNMGNYFVCKKREFVITEFYGTLEEKKVLKNFLLALL